MGGKIGDWAMKSGIAGYLVVGKNPETGRWFKHWHETVEDAEAEAEKAVEADVYECRKVLKKQPVEDRAAKAAVAFLERSGYELVESVCELAGRKWIVAKDGDELVFAFVTASYEGWEHGLDVKREDFESAMSEYFANNIDSVPECLVRCDELSMHVVSNDRALLRHHVNCFKDAEM